LQILLDDGPVVVVFVLDVAAPDCQSVLAGCSARQPASGERIVAIAPSPHEAARTISAKLGIGFPIVHDGAGRVAGLFGVAYRPPAAAEAWCRRLALRLAQCRRGPFPVAGNLCRPPGRYCRCGGFRDRSSPPVEQS
jgi:hypothetical protein